jgi:hypothetical protein
VPGKGRPFERGNPGKPKGARDRVQRGLAKRIVFEVLSDPKNLAAHMNALRAMATSTRTALAFAQLAARLNGEIGGREDHRGGDTTIVNFLALRPAESGAAPVQTVAKRRQE